MATTVLDTFITRFGYKTDTTGLDKAKKGLSDFKGMALKVGAAVGAILGGGFLLNKIADTADTTLKFADSIGVAIEMVDALGFAVQRQGGTVQGLRGSLEKINKTIGEVQRGQGMAKIAFEAYGLTVVKTNGDIKTADELFLELNKTFATLSKAQQFDLAKKMGIDTGTIKLLQTAPELVSDLVNQANRLGVLTRKDAEAMAAYNDSLTNMALGLKAVRIAIGRAFFGPLTIFFNLISDNLPLLRRHIRFIKVLAGTLTVLAGIYLKLKVAAAAAWLATFAPIIGIIAAIALLAGALALIIEDFVAFFKGQDSLIGDAVAKWPMLGDVIFAVRDAVIWLFDSTVAGFQIWLGWLTKIGQGFIDLGVIIWESIKAPIDAGIEKIKDLLNIVKNATGKIKSFFGFDGNANANLIPAQTAQMQGLMAQRGAVTNTSSNNITVKNISIDAKGGDSKEIAQNVGAALRQQLQNTVQDFDSGIKR